MSDSLPALPDIEYFSQDSVVLPSCTPKEFHTTLKSIYRHRAQAMPVTRRSTKTTGSQIAKPKPKPKPLKTKILTNRRHRAHPPLVDLLDASTTTPTQSISIPDEISEADTISQRSLHHSSVVSTEVLEKLEKMQETITKLTTEISSMKESHHDLATDFLKFKSEMNSEIRSATGIFKRGTIAVSAKEVLSNHLQRSPVVAASSSVGTSQKLQQPSIQSSMVGHGVRASELMD